MKSEPPELPVPIEASTDEAFTRAFQDPNIFIGVFEQPAQSPPPTTLSSGEILENLLEYDKAVGRFSLSVLHCVKPIKGTFVEPIVFISRLLPPRWEGRPRTPAFIPPLGSKWVLALEKTSQKTRVARFGKDIENYKFINDRTMFKVLWYGYGALCLKWPEGKETSQRLVKVPESIVDDLEAIQRVMPYTQKEKMDPKEMTAVINTSKSLKTDVAKSIFKKILGNKS